MSPEPLELVVVGHVTIDHFGGERRLGGAAAFAALSAARLGYRVGIVTAAGKNFPFWEQFEDVEVHRLEAKQTTEFANVYEGETRRQRLLALAAPISEEQLEPVRERLRADAAVLYSPVAHEVETPLVRLAPDGPCGVAPQGFYRVWDDAGEVSLQDWPGAEAAFARCDFVCLSEEDAETPEEIAESFPGEAFVITKGARGSRVYSGPDVYDFPAFAATEVDPTGAGDVFAVSFLLALRDKKPIPRAALIASCAASFAVEGVGTSSLPTRDELEARLRIGPS